MMQLYSNSVEQSSHIFKASEQKIRKVWRG